MANIISRGFGTLQRIITRGFFSGAAPSPDCEAPFQSTITGESAYQGVIDDSANAFLSIINDDPIASILPFLDKKAFQGTITDTQAFIGVILDYEAFEGEICDC